MRLLQKLVGYCGLSLLPALWGFPELWKQTKMKINLREPSTKRGIVMLITGGVVLYQAFWGSGVIDIDSVLARVDWWLGVGLTIVGMIGFLPDRDSEKRTRATDLPNIELQGRSESVTEDRRPAAVDQPAGDAAADSELHGVALPSERGADSGWNG